MLLIIAGAAALRLILIGQAPAGPHHDEAANLLDALDVLAGRFMVFSPRSYGREMLAMYVAAPLVALLGPDRLAVRLPTALAGVATIVATWALAREIFRQESRRLAQIAGLLAALFLSLSFWLLVLNRIGLRANYLPLTEVLCFLFLWRTVRTGRLWAYVAGGFFLGLAMHTYISARFVPVALVAFFGLSLLTRRGRALILPRWRRWLLLAAVALLVASPLLIFFSTHPESFLERAGQVSIFSPKLHHGDPLGLWLRSVLGNVGVFGFTGDHNPLYNLPGRPGLDAVQAVLFWLGIGLCVVRWRRPIYAFLGVWWLAMLLPSILAPDPIPHYLRAIGTLPAAAIIAARPLAGILTALHHRDTEHTERSKDRYSLLAWSLCLRGKIGKIAIISALAAVVLYTGLAGYNVWHTYFKVWLARDDVYYAYYGHLADLAGQINRETDPQAVYLFPVNYDRRNDTYDAYTLEVLDHGTTPFHYITVDDATAARDLTAMTAGKRQVKLVVWTNGEHIDADPRQVLQFYLERFGQKTGEQALRGYQILSYELPSAAVDFTVPMDWKPGTADYGALRLLAEAHRQAAPSGEAAWVALRWQVVRPPAGDLKVSLRLARSDSPGLIVGQSDGLLMDNAHRLGRRLPAGEELTTYHLVPVLPGTFPGAGQLSLVVYDPATLQPLPASQAPLSATAELRLGVMEVSPPVRPGGLQPEVPLPATRLARGVELTGYCLDRTSARPGEALGLALYWHVRRRPDGYASVAVDLVDGSGAPVYEWSQQPIWPMSRWQPGDEWRDWHTLPIPAGTPPGVYRLQVRIPGGLESATPAVTLSEFEVTD